jgi:hypothetical protein
MALSGLLSVSRFIGFQLSSFLCVIRRASLAFHGLLQRHVGLAACNVATRRSAAAVLDALSKSVLHPTVATKGSGKIRHRRRSKLLYLVGYLVRCLACHPHMTHLSMKIRVNAVSTIRTIAERKAPKQ